MTVGEPKKIYCPKCGRKAGVYNGHSTINYIAKCKKCKLLVVYNPNENRVRNEKEPERTCASGKRYY